MAKHVNFDGHTYILEKVGDKWEITKMIYFSVTGKIPPVGVSEEVRPILKKMQWQDEYRRKRDARNRKANANGKNCTDYSDCNQCGECSRSCIKTKKIRTDNPVHTILEHKEQRSEIRHKINQAISQLSPKQQIVIRQRYLEDKKVSEVSQSTGMSESSIKHIENRALEKLKDILGQNVNFRP